MQIRDAAKRDAEVLAEIYNDAVLNGKAIWTDRTVDSVDRVAWMTQRQQGGFPVRVMVDAADRVLGYASYGDWQSKDGYRFSVEHSVYVHQDARGQGAGRQLMVDLIRLAREHGKHVMVALIESGNQASIALHQQLGFVECGRVSQVGCKFGEWLDLTFMQLRLDDRVTP